VVNELEGYLLYGFLGNVCPKEREIVPNESCMYHYYQSLLNR